MGVQVDDTQAGDSRWCSITKTWSCKDDAIFWPERDSLAALKAQTLVVIQQRMEFPPNLTCEVVGTTENNQPAGPLFAENISKCSGEASILPYPIHKATK